MKYLLDTDVISQYTKNRPDPRVEAWLESVDDRELFLSMITFAELAQGVEQLPPGQKRRSLETWLVDHLLSQFVGRTLTIDTDIALHFGRLMTRAKRAGFTVGAMDGLIAATAAAKGMIVATLNRRDFEPLGVELVEW